MSKAREAVKLLEMCLPKLPTGGEGHKAVIDAIKSLGKAFPASEEVPGIQNTQLLGLQQKAQKDAMMQAVLRQQQAGAGGAGAGGAPGGGGMPPPAAAPPMAA